MSKRQSKGPQRYAHSEGGDLHLGLCGSCQRAGTEPLKRCNYIGRLELADLLNRDCFAGIDSPQVRASGSVCWINRWSSVK